MSSRLDFQPDESLLSPVEEQTGSQGAPVSAATQPETGNMFQRCSIPALTPVSADSLRQFIKPGVPQNRLSPLPILTPSAISGPGKTVTQVVSSRTSSTPQSTGIFPVFPTNTTTLGGQDKAVQVNSQGVLYGSPALTWDKILGALTVTGTVSISGTTQIGAITDVQAAINSKVSTIQNNGTPVTSSSGVINLIPGTNITLTTYGDGITIASTGGGSGMSNPMTAAGDLIVGGTSGAPTRLAAGVAERFLMSNGAGLSYQYIPVRLVSAVIGKPAAGQEVLIFAVDMAMTFPANFTGAVGGFGPNGAHPAATAVYSVYSGSTLIGTVTVSTSGVFTFATTGGISQAVSAGMMVAILAPSVQDAALASVAITLQATPTWPS